MFSAARIAFLNILDGARFGRSALFAGVLIIAVGAPAPLSAFGILLPRERDRAPHIAYSAIQQRGGRVDITIENRLATTRIRQAFYNPNPMQLEADFNFPVPRGAQVVDFALTINGKMTQAETLPQPQARQIYEDIVRRAKDPALIEWVDRDLYRVRIFPVPANGVQEIEVAFAQQLPRDEGLIRYSLPLHRPALAAPPPQPIRPMPRPFDGRPDRVNRAGGAEPATGGFSEDMPIRATVRTSETLRLISSPTHDSKLERLNDHEARLDFDGKALAQSPNRTLEIHILPTGQPVALAAAATRPRSDEDGYFSLTLSPPWKAPGPDTAGHAAPPPQNIVFVIDTSGSMADRTDKIGQARRALATCLRQIRREDRFALIRFSSDVSTFRDGLVEATPENIQFALEWVERLTARGGTNISGALEEALALMARADSTSTGGAVAAPSAATVVFLTDGIANIGLTRPDDIVALTRKNEKRTIRLFTFGVGYDVQAVLLDRLALDTGGSMEYVRPDEDLELPVSRLFNKVSLPAMTEVRLEVLGVDVHDRVPTGIPDLFHGTDTVIVGRYRAPNSLGTTATVRVTGQLYGKTQSLETQAYFPASERASAYIEKLWATRKLASLLDQYRGGGSESNQDDLKKEIEGLCQRHNMVSPLTSMLVVEDGEGPIQPIARAGRVDTPQAMVGGFGGRGVSLSRSDSMRMSAAQANASVPASADQAGFATAESGRAAVEQSLRLKSMRDGKGAAEVKTETSPDERRVAGRTFRLDRSQPDKAVWVDGKLDGAGQGGTKETLTILYLSDAWFALSADPDLRDVLQLGPRVRFEFRNMIIQIHDDGNQTPAPLQQLDAEKRKRLGLE